MERAELLSMVKRLGAEFRKRRMHGHLAPLRLYWLALRHGLVQPERHGLHVQLSEEMIVEWFRLLRLPPYERAYPVQPPGSRCPSCRPGEGTFPEGRKVACLACRAAWLELEPPTRMGRGSDASRKKRSDL
jgi:hypothetical protein